MTGRGKRRLRALFSLRAKGKALPGRHLEELGQMCLTQFLKNRPQASSLGFSAEACVGRGTEPQGQTGRCVLLGDKAGVSTRASTSKRDSGVF